MDKVAKELIFSPIIRVIVPKGGCNGYTEEELALNNAVGKFQSWTKQELIEWIVDHHETTFDSSEEYDKEND